MLSVDGLKVYNARETAEMLGTQVVTIRSYIKSGKIKAQKIGGKWYIASPNIQASVKGDSPEEKPEKRRQLVTLSQFLDDAPEQITLAAEMIERNIGQLRTALFG